MGSWSGAGLEWQGAGRPWDSDRGRRGGRGGVPGTCACRDLLAENRWVKLKLRDQPPPPKPARGRGSSGNRKGWQLDGTPPLSLRPFLHPATPLCQVQRTLGTWLPPSPPRRNTVPPPSGLHQRSGPSPPPTPTPYYVPSRGTPGWGVGAPNVFVKGIKPKPGKGKPGRPDSP